MPQEDAFGKLQPALILAIAGALIVGLAIGFSLQPRAPQPSAYRHSTGFSFELPASMSVEKINDGTFRLASKEGKPYELVIKELGSPVLSEASIAALHRTYRATFEGFTVLYQKSDLINGTGRYELGFYSVYRGKPVIQRQLLASNGTKGFVLSLSTTPEAFTTAGAETDGIFRTFAVV